MIGLTEIRLICDIIKSRSGIYVDNPKNRALHRVGHSYGRRGGGDNGNNGAGGDGVIENGKINYKKLNQLTNEILNGRKRINSLNRQEEEGRIAGGKRNVEASIILGGEKENIGVSLHDARRRQEKLIEDYARHKGCWFSNERLEQIVGDRMPSGEESKVYHAKEGNYVIKVTYPYIMSSDLDDFLTNRVSLNNYLFPGTAYEVLGFMRNEITGDINVVLKQPLIEGQLLSFYVKNNNLTHQQGVDMIINDLSGRIGQVQNDEYDDTIFENSNYVIDDLHFKNVMINDGKLYYIDVVTTLNAEDYEDGQRVYGSGKIVDNG